MNALASQYFDYIANILSLDDSVFDRARLRRALQSARIRCRIQEVESLHAAEAALNSNEFDLAILDYDLPDGTGHDMIKLLQHCPLNSQASVMMITGNQSTRIAKTSLEMGCLACISKEKITPQDLKFAVVEAMYRSRYRSLASQPDSMSNSHGDLP